MKLSEFAAKIAIIAKKYPDYKAVYSRDDEGNGFQEIYYDPTAGHFDDDGEFIAHNDNDIDGREPNAVCVN